MWREDQSQFADAMLDPTQMIGGLAYCVDDASTTRRVAIYRNNVTVGLREALAATFPTVAALLGGDCFNEVARQYLRLHPPSTPVLIDYGGGFADYLVGAGLGDAVPYVSDVARLDWARHVAYHAEDATPAGIECLAAIPQDAVELVRLRLHPSVQLISSGWPIASIWRAHQVDDPATALSMLPAAGEHVVVLRPAFEVQVRTLARDAYALICALAEGRPLGAALDAAVDAGCDDPSACLAELFRTGAVAGLDDATTDRENRT